MFRVVAHTQYGPVVLARFCDGDEDKARKYAQRYRDNGVSAFVEYSGERESSTVEDSLPE